MNYKEFIEYYKSTKFVPTHGYLEPGILSNSYFSVPWEFRAPFTEQMGAEDFGCNFKDNRCVMERNCDLSEWWSGLGKDSQHVSYCCSSCYISVGNLRLLPDDEQALEWIASLFDYEGKRGFWREDEGCILPHRFRSTLCLIDRCDYLKENLKPRKELLQKTYNLLNIKSLYKLEQIKKVK